MNPATHGSEGSKSALELSNKTWRFAFSDGANRRLVMVPAANLVKLSEALAKTKERFSMPGSDGELLRGGPERLLVASAPEEHRIENQVVDAASIEVSRRLRHVKTLRMSCAQVAFARGANSVVGSARMQLAS